MPQSFYYKIPQCTFIFNLRKGKNDSALSILRNLLSFEWEGHIDFLKTSKILRSCLFFLRSFLLEKHAVSLSSTRTGSLLSLQTGNQPRAESDLLTQYQWEVHFCWLLLLYAYQKCYYIKSVLILYAMCNINNKFFGRTVYIT